MSYYPMSGESYDEPLTENGIRSLYAAINFAAKCNKEKVCVRKGSARGEVVWFSSVMHVYHKYIGEDYCGYFIHKEDSVSRKQAELWVRKNAGSRVITGHAHFLEHPHTIKPQIFKAWPVFTNPKEIKGCVEGVFPESNVGAHYYNFTKFTTKYDKASAVFDLRDSRFKLKNPKEEHRPFNLYIFVGIKQEGGHTFEAGFRINSECVPIQLQSYIKGARFNYKDYSSYALGLRGSEHFHGEKLKVSLSVPADEWIKAEFEDYKSGTCETIVIHDPSAFKHLPKRYFTAVSLVSYYRCNCELFDLQAGCYGKNIKIQDVLLHNSSNSNKSISFAPSESISNHVYLADSYYGEYSQQGKGKNTIETISLDYNKR